MSKNKQTRLFEDKKVESGPVTCFGKEFESDKARREYFTEELRRKLQETEFRSIEGFPVGEDEDILALSDPPYYTACPNPWIKDFIEQWEKEKPTPESDEPYHREPFAADVSEGKNDPIYNAHSYHTKVPHKAIMRYILHYTEPGDIVFDGFCGTGMTGVAAQMCGNKEEVESLGVSKKSPKQEYLVKNNGIIFDGNNNAFSLLGQRHPILSDLSTIATFIAGTMNAPVCTKQFIQSTGEIIDRTENELSWLYETNHKQSQVGKINYIVWSEVFICSNCSFEFSFFDGAYDKETDKLSQELVCPQCGVVHKKRNLERAFETVYDDSLNESITQVKQTPVLINYSIGTKRHKKLLDEKDKLLIKKINDFHIEDWFPNAEIPKIERFFKDGLHLININNTAQFYTKRNLLCAAKIYCNLETNNQKLVFTSFCDRHIVKRNRWLPTGPTRPLNNTLFFPPLYAEVNVFNIARRKLKDHAKAYDKFNGNKNPLVTCQSSTQLSSIPDSSIDYIFTDPPFGWNLIYSELSFLWESWLKVRTSNTLEVIVNEKDEKTLDDYRRLITDCFKENYRILKPGKWMTVEFHNSSNSVWISIQEALTIAGFIVADVKTIDKKQGSINQDYYRGGAVKQDLAISAYKPTKFFEKNFVLKSGTEEGVWVFIKNHLAQLPVVNVVNGKIKSIVERNNYLLFDRMVAFHIQHNVSVPISASEFYNGLSQRFSERDNMFFLPEQVADYDRKKMTVKELVQITLFVSDEASAIQWLRQLLKSKPQTFSDINPLFMQEISGWKKTEKPLELSTLLKQNFLLYDGNEKVPEQIHAYLSTNWKDMRNLPKEDPILKAKAKDRWYVPDPNKAGDLEKLRERDLLKEFESYKAVKKFKRTDRFRLEAVRAGFKNAWQVRDYETIIAIAEKIPPKILEEDPKLLMWYDQAVTRMGDE